MGKIVYKKGNLLDAEEPIIVHQVNCMGVMASGVAKAIRDKYPEVFTQYRSVYREECENDLLGAVQYVKINGVTIVNLFGQKNYLPRGIKHTSYDALYNGFSDINKQMEGDIAIPKIGCGLGGGDWNVVEQIILEVFKDSDRQITVYEL